MQTVSITNKDKSVTISVPFTTVEEIAVWQYKLSLLEGIDIKTDVDLFTALNKFEDLDSVKQESCGKCDSHDIGFRVREDDDGNKYYEKVCRKCGARLSFGAHKKPQGSLFAKRRQEDKSPKGVRGWTKWNHELKKEE